MTNYRKIDRFAADPDYRRQPKTDYFCINCNKTIDPTKPHRLVRVIDKGDSFLHPQDVEGYMLEHGFAALHPMGNDCAKRLGLEWSIPSITDKE